LKRSAAFQKRQVRAELSRAIRGILIGDPIYLPIQKAIFAAAAELAEKELASDRAKLLASQL
jgi:hypothetical protein